MNQERSLDEVPIAHHWGGGTYAKEARIPAGFVLVQHKHQYDHLSILASGTAVVSTDSEKREYEGPAVIHIKAGVHHAVQALTDCAWFCIHATDVTDPDGVDETLVMEPDLSQMRRMAGVS